MYIHNDDRICSNCAHWDIRREVCAPHNHEGSSHLSPCKVRAIEADANDCCVFMGADCSCRDFEDAFQVSEACLEELRQYGHVLEDRLRDAGIWGLPCNP